MKKVCSLLLMCTFVGLQIIAVDVDPSRGVYYGGPTPYADALRSRLPQQASLQAERFQKVARPTVSRPSMTVEQAERKLNLHLSGSRYNHAEVKKRYDQERQNFLDDMNELSGDQRLRLKEYLNNEYKDFDTARDVLLGHLDEQAQSYRQSVSALNRKIDMAVNDMLSPVLSDDRISVQTKNIVLQGYKQTLYRVNEQLGLQAFDSSNVGYMQRFGHELGNQMRQDPAFAQALNDPNVREALQRFEQQVEGQPQYRATVGKMRQEARRLETVSSIDEGLKKVGGISLGVLVACILGIVIQEETGVLSEL